MKFIDLFCGIGGFHQALVSLGHECVFASDIDKYSIETYQQNYGMKVSGDISKIEAKDIPEHDILCAGFPCQAFSVGGYRKGFADQTRGTLFFEITRILEHHKTKYIMLENVKNLIGHDDGNTWNVIKNSLIDLGYQITQEPLVLSPHKFGTPQLRERVYILGKYDPENSSVPLEIESLQEVKNLKLDSVFETTNSNQKLNITSYEQDVLNCWEEFYQNLKHQNISFSIWTEYFGYTGSLAGMPKWKSQVVQKNIDLYNNNKTFIDSWLLKHNNLENFTNKAHKKFEWQAGKNINTIWDGIIQFRQSGVRVKRPNYFQTLVAIVQIPIVGKLKRRLSVREVARLQDFPDTFIINKNERQAYKQFGNSVNVKIVKMLAEKLLPEVDKQSEVL